MWKESGLRIQMSRVIIKVLLLISHETDLGQVNYQPQQFLHLKQSGKQHRPCKPVVQLQCGDGVQHAIGGPVLIITISSPSPFLVTLQSLHNPFSKRLFLRMTE